MNYNINLPYINEAFYTPDVAKQNEIKIKSGVAKYGDMIKKISDITHVPADLLTSIAFIESGFNPNAHSQYASGITQLSTSAASDTIIKEKGLGRIEAPEEAILKKYLGSRWDLIKNVKKGQTSIGKTFVTDSDLYNPEFSFLVSGFLLGQLIDEFSIDGKLLLDRAIILYNGGRYSPAAKKAITFKGTPKELITQVPKETADYIRKLLGINGILHTAV